MNVLVVAAHPDDEVLGVGGVMARHIEAGDRVAVLILGEGISSRYPKRELAKPHEFETLKKASKKALAALGVKEVTFGDFPDNRFDSIDLLDLVKCIENVKKKYKPAVIYTHHDGDLNIDHALTARAVITATRPVKTETVKKIYAFEILSSSEWNFQRSAAAFKPNCYFDITKHLGRKIKAFSAYESEKGGDLHPRSERGIRLLAEYRGIQVGMKACEAFELVREIA